MSITLRRAPAPLALMGLIFLLSAQPELSTDLGLADLILRKAAHIVAFGTLTLLWWWALRPLGPRALPLAASIALAYAISDEYHQTFVEGRVGIAAGRRHRRAGNRGRGRAGSRQRVTFRTSAWICRCP